MAFWKRGVMRIAEAMVTLTAPRADPDALTVQFPPNPSLLHPLE
jgi:hypothetical protein